MLTGFFFIINKKNQEFGICLTVDLNRIIILRVLLHFEFYMFKQKYLYILTFIVLALIAFKFHTSLIAEERDDLLDENHDLPLENPGPAAEIKDLVSSYDSIISTGIKEAGTVGAAVVITYKNEIAYLKCFGVRKVGENDSINKKLLNQKRFTGTAREKREDLR